MGWSLDDLIPEAREFLSRCPAWNDMTPEERDKLTRSATGFYALVCQLLREPPTPPPPPTPTVGDLCFLSLDIRGFLSVTVPDLIQEPAPPAEPYTPKDDIPPSPYIPLALR
jgi:hypothetical protein